MIVRELLQSCESWIRHDNRDNGYRNIANKIFQMLFEVDQSIFQNRNSIGVKLEDLKEYPKKTIQALCNWLGIKENDCLHQMTAQGKKWWGDPSGLNYNTDGMDPFGKNPINRKVGSILAKMINLFYVLSSILLVYILIT